MPSCSTLHSLSYLLLSLSTLSSFSFLYWSYHPSNHCPQTRSQTQTQTPPLNLLSLSTAWNHLSFSPLSPSSTPLTLALFVKKWPHPSRAGGLERHALTLHLALAERGHQIHIFTTTPQNPPLQPSPHPNLHFHFIKPTPSGFLNQARAVDKFRELNRTHLFDLIHTESVALSHANALTMQCNVVASWHGFAYETVSSDLAMDLTREPKEPRPLSLHQRLASRLFWIIDEINFFGDYSHHVATSEHAGDVLRRVYMLPPDRVHVILNGVDNGFFRPDPPRGAIFRRNFGVPENASLVFGLAGRLVKDKGHPLMFQALIQILKDRNNSGVFVLVAGDGPWGKRYRELGPNILVLGPLERERLAGFYNALDVFVNPTLRAQGLDHTLLEAMASGKPVMATGFASITGSVIVGEEVGYTFSPTVESLKVSLSRVLAEGKGVFDKKGEKARERAAKLFTSAKMAAAYERLFLCLSPRHRKNGGLDFCRYPLPSDQ